MAEKTLTWVIFLFWNTNLLQMYNRPPQTWYEQVYRKTMAKKSLLELSVFLIKNFNFLMRWAGKNSP